MAEPKRIIVLGATGSIGRSAAAVLREHPAELRPVAFAALNSRSECEALAREFGARAFVGAAAAEAAVAECEADVCLVATVGLSALAPTLLAIERGMDIALATKEVLVMAGELVMAAAARRGVRVRPVDSEHSAIFQCLNGGAATGVERLILTASGGPFLDSPADLAAVTPAAALAHPKWQMGAKVSVDSATMMNKGFEVLEARWLFSVEPERIEVVIHPEAVVHSLVTFVDGATLAQLSPPDMRVAIQYALVGPERLAAPRERLDLAALGRLTFRRPDLQRFPALAVALEAVRRGGAAPAAVAAADEWAVAEFLAGRLGFTAIAAAAQWAMERFAAVALPDAAAVCELAREVTAFLAGDFKGK